tara:strand:+ start:483 stop:716 length:234 start_codon:yes stop_codon:yes gene_type:complete
MNDPKFVKSELKVVESEELKAELAIESASAHAAEDKDILDLLIVKGGCCGEDKCCDSEGPCEVCGCEDCKCGVSNED